MTSSLCVLIIDDNEDFLEVLAMDVKELGFQVVSGTSADEAIQQMTKFKVDIILSDLHMDGKSGMDLLSTLRSQGNLIPFIFLTGAATKNIAIEALRKGAFDVLEKPVDENELRRVLERAAHLASRLAQVPISNFNDPHQKSATIALMQMGATAVAFDDGNTLSAEELNQPELEPGAFVTEPEAAHSHDTQSHPYFQGKSQTEGKVKLEIYKLLSQNSRAIRLLSRSSFLKTSLGFLCNAYNLVSESAQSIGEHELAEHSEIVRDCFAYFRVSPMMLNQSQIKIFAQFNQYLIDQTVKGDAARDQHQTILDAIKAIHSFVLSEAA